MGKCQEGVTKIHQELLDFAANSLFSSKAPQTIHCQLTNQEQIMLLAALRAHEAPFTFFLSGGPRQAETLTKALNKVATNLFAVGGSWHTITSSLTEQELSGDVVSSLSQTIHHLLQNTPATHFVIPSSLVTMSVPDPAAYSSLILKLHTQENISPSKLAELLVQCGYRRHQESLAAGSFHIRGEQVDIKLAAGSMYFTITFFGSTIESIVQHHNRRSQTIARLTIPPALFPRQSVPLGDVIINHSIWHPTDTLQLRGQRTIIYNSLVTALKPPWQEQSSTTAATATTIVLYENRDRVQRYLDDHQLHQVILCESPVATIPLQGATSTTKLISESFLFPTSHTPKPVSYEQGRALIAELTPNHPAVHSDHGIGIYEGLQERTINNQTREYLILRYAAGDTLSVPVEYAHKVTPYVGETQPNLHRLGGTLWQKTRRQAEHDAAQFAAELVEVASRRAATSGHTYYLDPTVEDHLNNSFPHHLTPDQEYSWQEVQQDLLRPQPMDRLIVGDVGFGKTEIAIRAAYHVANNGKQVAVLAPTTLLVQQHADRFRERLGPLQISIGVLSRFATPREQKQLRKKIQTGEVSIAVGTHALLSKSTVWKNLGLVIIDEEQRFGVKHKEYFKRLRANIDILSLSATPIPRTLSMALTGLKELSVISSPPQGRQSVITHVQRDSDKILKAAIQHERDRSGQTYVVAPKIRHLGSLAHRIHQLLPQASVAVAHGQLSPQELANIMARFDQGQLDVLVSSTIIENGIDLPRANTMIVTHATHFGLSDLYQLRGRVGRRDVQGHAYFLYNQHELTDIQRQRLTALTEASRLGSGWTLAQRDLEIRGAGNLLGAEQSGTVNAIGVQFYLDLIDDALHKKETPLRRHDVDISLPLLASLPTHFIASGTERTRWYQQLARAKSLNNLETVTAELAKKYGPLPDEATNLVRLLRLQHAAAKASITSITTQAIAPPDEDPYLRLLIKGQQLPQTLTTLSSLGNWAVRDNTLTLDRDHVTPQFIDDLTQLLLSS